MKDLTRAQLLVLTRAQLIALVAQKTTTPYRILVSMTKVQLVQELEKVENPLEPEQVS